MLIALLVLADIAFGDELPPMPIINGEDAEIEDFPATGALLFDYVYDQGTNHSDHIRGWGCSSTLIAPDVVLLAAHCIDTEMSLAQSGHNEVSSVEFGWTRDPDLRYFDTGDDWPDDTVFAADWVSHENWDYYELELGLAENYDIALLFLEEALDVPHAYLPTHDEATRIVEGLEVEVVGWGAQEDWTSGEKQWGTSYVNAVNEFEMQIGGQEEDTRKCYGDSGGPSFMTVKDSLVPTKRLVGVTSHIFNNSACESVGVVDTRVDHYLEWIDDQMQERCADGSRVWCDEPGIPSVLQPIEESDGHAGGCASAKTPRSWSLSAAAIGLFALASRVRRRRAGMAAASAVCTVLTGCGSAIVGDWDLATIAENGETIEFPYSYTYEGTMVVDGQLSVERDLTALLVVTETIESEDAEPDVTTLTQSGSAAETGKKAYDVVLEESDDLDALDASCTIEDHSLTCAAADGATITFVPAK